MSAPLTLPSMSQQAMPSIPHETPPAKSTLTRPRIVTPAETQPYAPNELPKTVFIGKRSAESMRFYQHALSIDSPGNALNKQIAYMRAKAQQTQIDTENTQATAPADATAKPGEKGYTRCETCENRQYQDGSDDSGVSFQAPGSISASLSGIRVAAHESEHVSRETGDSRDAIITNKHVTIHMRFCPDCGRMYAAGGKTVIQKIEKSEGAVSVRGGDKLLALGDQIDSFV